MNHIIVFMSFIGTALEGIYGDNGAYFMVCVFPNTNNNWICKLILL